ncbi:autotransporter outer membrane beta-barrel domain-containing protein [Actinobacillus equuli]|uniref:Outer membrane autotransporter ycgv n=1 Tax=Actinobacillus equuli TaxID=718 RepID=A0AAX3FIS7_ACTEU|nr:autotransporter outer membrane beta-barrel domain-containing protein [Actinobacillus equuli]AIZ79719.1 pertactin [Actinobacillus equuli subsp. equuli]WGE43829.1 autotransporter outer membrane beta-barrel domain-containing protein [Actinobacillus equuli subsp. equuli]VEE90513.1 outer membrane autotransporter ycgv [Actinobacillus equuli]
MKRLKLSAVYSALLAGGLFIYADSAIAMECKAGEVEHQNGVSLNNCTLTTKDPDFPWALVYVSDSDNIIFNNLTTNSDTRSVHANKSNVTIKNSSLTASNTNADQHYFESVVQSESNSNVKIENSTLVAKPYHNSASVISLSEGNMEINNSVLSLNESDTPKAARAFAKIYQGNLSIRDSQLNVENAIESFFEVTSGTNININIENTVGKSNTSTFLDISGGSKVNVELVNSQFSGGISGAWDLFEEKEQFDLDLMLTNSNLSSKVLFHNSQLLPYSRSTTKYLIENINLVAKNSNLSGVGRLLKNEEGNYDDIFNVTLETSNWNLNGYYPNFSVTNLDMKNATVKFGQEIESAPAESWKFHTLEILGNLSGTGNFTLNSDLANQQADKIVVTGDDSGEFGLNVKDSGNEPKSANGKVTLVETQTGKAKFALLGRDYVDAGAYRYRLVKDGNHWVLSNHATERATASNSTPPVANNSTNSTASPTMPVSPIVVPSLNPTTANREVMLSEYSNALVSLRQAQLLLVENSLEGLHKRLGELKQGEKGNVWVRNANSRNELDAMQAAENAHSSGFKQDIHTLQIGTDAAVTDNIRVGGFVGNSRSDLEFGGEYGSAKVKAQAVGVYATYLANNGFYWDNVAKYERITAKSNQTGKRHYNAHTLSSEIGRIHTLGRWTITPQLQAAWTKLSSKVDEEGISALTARAGVRVANHLDFAGWKFEPYAELNGITTRTNQNAVRVNQYSFDVAETKGRIESAIGANAVVGNHRIGLEASLTNGKYLDQPYKVQLAYRYHW